MSRALLAAIAQAQRGAADGGVDVLVGKVTAWATPLATVTLSGASVPGIRTITPARGDMAVGKLVLVLTTGSLAVILGVLN
ncbi:MAG: hypothetical protein Q7V58_09430 [Actinomycetota bacterium]|nr:hypothetical protein [Actinomycetota bacterium]